MKAKTSGKFGEEHGKISKEMGIKYRDLKDVPEKEQAPTLIRLLEDLVCISGTIAHNMLFATGNQKIKCNIYR